VCRYDCRDCPPWIDPGWASHRVACFGQAREYPPDHAGCRPFRAQHRRAGSSIGPATSACLDGYPHVADQRDPCGGST
jgi:hypothetical protein